MGKTPQVTTIKGLVQTPSGWRKLRRYDVVLPSDLVLHYDVTETSVKPAWRRLDALPIPPQGTQVWSFGLVIRKKGYNGRKPPVRYRKGKLAIPRGYRRLPQGEKLKTSDRWPSHTTWVRTMDAGALVGHSIPYIRRIRTKTKKS